jgi:hypothetical protein
VFCGRFIPRVRESEGGKTSLDYTGRDADEEHSCGVYFTSGVVVGSIFVVMCSLLGMYTANAYWAHHVYPSVCLSVCPSVRPSACFTSETAYLMPMKSGVGSVY